MAPRILLSEKEQIDILLLAEKHEHQWTFIGNKIGRSPSTCKHFFNRYQKSHKLNQQLGRPPVITEEKKQEVVKFMLADPLQNLSDISKEFDLADSTVKKILNDNKIKYFQRIPVSPLANLHKQKRAEICGKIISIPFKNYIPIIFSDESSIEIQEIRGIWRQPGTYPPQTFYEKDIKTMSAMVWGGIGPNGYRTKLIFFEEHINAETYIKALEENRILENIKETFGKDWVWEQDNASSHTAKDTINYLGPRVPYLFDWPPKSPDLSPIEQVWNYLKVKISGRHFSSPRQIYEALQEEWNKIPNEIIHNLYTSFWARCYVCHENNGDHLNGHWKRVREVHDQYRNSI